MARTQEIWSTVSHVTGVPFSEVSEIGRRIREAGLFVKETRSPNSPRATPENVANLLIAIMSGASSRKAAEAVERYRSTSRFNRQHYEFADQEMEDFARKNLPVLLNPAASFVDCVTDLVTAARDVSGIFETELKYTGIEVEQRTFSGIVNLQVSKYNPLPAEIYSGPILFENDDFCDLQPEDCLTVTAALGPSVFSELGRILRRPEE